MQTALIDPSILPEQARTELHDFYHFLVGKYAPTRKRQAKQQNTATGTAAALAASPLAGMWKDRNLPDSPIFARSLRETAQNRNLS
jgi:hypothetical protein